MKIYIAASMDNKNNARGIELELKGMGYGITSSWYHTNIKDRRLAALSDLSEIDNADYIIFLTDKPSTKGGRHIEFGYALAKYKKIIIFGKRESCFTYLDQVECCDSFSSLLLCL